MIRNLINRFLPLILFLTFVVTPLSCAAGFGSFAGYTAGMRDCAEELQSIEEVVPTRLVFAQYDASMGMPVATATPKPEVPTDNLGAFSMLMKGIEMMLGGGPLATIGLGFMIMGAVFLVGQHAPTLFPKKHLSKVSLLVPPLLGFGLALALGVDPLAAAFATLCGGGLAVALWEAFGKDLWKTWRGEKEDPRPVLKP